MDEGSCKLKTSLVSWTLATDAMKGTPLKKIGEEMEGLVAIVRQLLFVWSLYKMLTASKLPENWLGFVFQEPYFK